MTSIFFSAESEWSIITKEAANVKCIICYVACEIQSYERIFVFCVKQLPSCKATALSKKDAGSYAKDDAGNVKETLIG